MNRGAGARQTFCLTEISGTNQSQFVAGPENMIRGLGLFYRNGGGGGSAARRSSVCPLAPLAQSGITNYLKITGQF